VPTVQRTTNTIGITFDIFNGNAILLIILRIGANCYVRRECCGKIRVQMRLNSVLEACRAQRLAVVMRESMACFNSVIHQDSRRRHEGNKTDQEDR